MKTVLFCFSAIALLALVSAASNVNIIEPHNITVSQNSTIFLGKVGPGQTFFVTVSAATQNSTGYIFDRGWNKLIVTNAPVGWVVENSSLYGSTLSIKMTPAQNAQNGTYSFNLTALNLGNYSKLGSVEFHALINVTPDVFKLQITPTNISTGPGEPATIYVTINNTGVSDSPFVININGLPAWNSSKTVIALHGTTGNFTYPVYEDEPGVYQAKLGVNSEQSSLVSKSSDITLTIQASVFNDYAALGQGAIALPIIYEPVYAIMQIISAILKALNISF